MTTVTTVDSSPSLTNMPKTPPRQISTGRHSLAYLHFSYPTVLHTSLTILRDRSAKVCACLPTPLCSTTYGPMVPSNDWEGATRLLSQHYCKTASLHGGMARYQTAEPEHDQQCAVTTARKNSPNQSVPWAWTDRLIKTFYRRKTHHPFSIKDIQQKRAHNVAALVKSMA